MSPGTGLGTVERAALKALHAMGATSSSRFRKTLDVLSEMDRRFGISPSYGYMALRDLSASWSVNLPLLDIRGNWGTPTDPPAHASRTECRLSPVGDAAALADANRTPPLPIRLINGTMHTGGSAPPFHPTRTIDALVATMDRPHLSDEELSGIIGLPHFPSGCDLSGDVDAVLSGDQGTMFLVARASTDSGWIRISNLPIPASSELAVVELLKARPPGTTDVVNRSRADRPLIDIRMAMGADPAQLIPELLAMWPLTIGSEARLEAPLPTIVRSWVDKAQEHRYLSGHLREFRATVRDLNRSTDRLLRRQTP